MMLYLASSIVLVGFVDLYLVVRQWYGMVWYRLTDLSLFKAQSWLDQGAFCFTPSQTVLQFESFLGAHGGFI